MSGCKKPKRKPYGTVGTEPYCIPHDQHENYVVSKKSVRHKAKRDIKKQMNEEE